MTVFTNEAFKEVGEMLAKNVLNEVRSMLEAENSDVCEYVRKNKACELLGVSDKTLEEWERLGLIKYRASPNSRATFYKVSELYEMITRYQD